MRRSIFLVGSLMLVVGFIVYQFGFSSELHQTTLLGRLWAQLGRTAILGRLTLEAVAVILQFAGGLLAIFGLIVCFAAVARPNETRPKSGTIEYLTTEPERASVNCRFCAAQIVDGSSFCPVCKKSQT